MNPLIAGMKLINPISQKVRMGSTKLIQKPILESQNCFSIPACFKTAFAVCLDRIFWSTGKRLSVIGLYQFSWTPLPGHSKWQQ